MRGRRRCAAAFDPPENDKEQDWALPFALLRKTYNFSKAELRDMDEPEMAGYLSQVERLETRASNALGQTIATLLGKMFAK